MSPAIPDQRRQVYTVRNCERRSTLAACVTIAGISRERRRGLKTAILTEELGLWIVPCEAIHTFGMKVCIDAVFLDHKLRVRHIRTGLMPRRISFCLRAHSVLELASGVAARSHTIIGDRLEFVRNEDLQ